MGPTLLFPARTRYIYQVLFKLHFESNLLTMAMKVMKATKKAVLKRIKTQKTLGKTVTIAGKKYDQEMIYAFRRATRSSKGNKGKNVLISVADAKQIFEATRPDLTGRSTYDKLEKSTMAYIRRTGNFTDAAKKELAKLIARQLENRLRARRQ